MKNEKKHPKKQLEKYTNIFMQLSLVLVLFVVYQLIEFETVEKKFSIIVPDSSFNYELLTEDNPSNFIKEQKKNLKKAPPKVLILDELDPKKEDEVLIEDLLPDLEPLDKIESNINIALNNYVPEDPKIIEEVAFIIIEDAPVFKGCEGLSQEENKICFISSIQKFVIQRFDVDLAQELNLRSGKYKIFAQFVISKTGNINEIKIKAPHPKLEKEAKNIIKKLPQFTPGMQRKVPVNVKFALPITFSVH
ncbi:energy transducer TonB [Polaribacter uvawellassae]|uniref:energy transducer TonB n=1 Tax=Polaribacter uvawellassae TaxID=3133495 RepID=UPI0032191AE2